MSTVPATSTVPSVTDATKGFITAPPPPLSPAGLVMTPSMELEPTSPFPVHSWCLPWESCGSMSQDETAAPPMLPRMPQEQWQASQSSGAL